MDYTQIAMESILTENSIYRKEQLGKMVNEEKFLLSSLESGSIEENYVQEGALEDASKKLLENLQRFLDNTIDVFLRKQVEWYSKYSEPIGKEKDSILEKAKTGSLDLAPFWEGNYDKDLSLLQSCINEGFQYPFVEGDISFANQILKTIKKPTDLDDANLSKMLKNKFRFGVEEPDENNIKKLTVKGNELVSITSKMIDYVVTDYKRIANSLKKLKATWLQSAKQLRGHVEESGMILTKDTVSLLEQCLLSEMDLSLLEGFSMLPDTVWESTDGNAGGNSKPAPTASSSEKKNNSLNTVENNVKEEEKKQIENGEKPAPKGNGNRYKMVDRFVRRVFTAYITSLEERFILYVKAIAQVNGGLPQPEDKKKKK